MRDLIHELVTHYADLRRQLARDLRDPHHAADIAQSSFERAYVHAIEQRSTTPAGTGDGIESPRALLFRVARNLCIDDARRRKVAREWAATHTASESQRVAPSTETLFVQHRVLEQVVAALERLTPRRREVFLLFRAYGHTRAEIAQQLAISEMAVAKHIVRAAIDCSRVFAALRAELPDPLPVYNHTGFHVSLAEDKA